MFDTSLTGSAAPLDDLAAAGLVRTATRSVGLSKFIAGEENRLAYSVVAKLLDEAVWAREQAAATAAKAAAADEEPPLVGGLVVLYGPTGTGKTHLLEALAAHWRARLPADVVVAMHGGEFAEEYAAGVDRDDLEPLRKRVREADLFLLDDAGRLLAKPPAQWELLHTLDALEKRGAYVVVALDRAPHAAETLLPGLVGRLCGGTVVELSTPSQASRREILATVAADRGLKLEPRALDLLAADRDAGVRELHGSLARLEAEALDRRRREAASTLFDIHGDEPPPVDAALVRKYLDRRSAADAPTLKQIVEHTARHFGLRSADLKSGSRRRNVVAARDTAIYLARRLTKKSLQEIGEFFGGRDHTTILHSCRKLEAAEEQDATQRGALAALREKLLRG
ncbi:MAG: AAA family ATPase [Planctomycetaceae bacterium]|nr:AAA family ATPase [Planctomycetaceae bacterium]